MCKNQAKVYTVDFKVSSAKLAVESDQLIAQTARDLGINENTLYTWIKKYGPKPTSGTLAKPGHMPNVYEEIQRLQKENARLKQERDILKKALQASVTHSTPSVTASIYGSATQCFLRG